MDDSGQPPPGRDAHGRFAAGNPGRPFGSRNRVSKRVARTILRDFEANQESVLPRLRRWFLPQYVQLISRLLPRQMEEGGAELESLSEVELAGLLVATRVALDRIEAGEGSIAELESALLGERHNLAAVIIGD
jgi:hypothetical protein